MINKSINTLITSPFWAATILKAFLNQTDKNKASIPILHLALGILLYKDTMNLIVDRRKVSSFYDLKKKNEELLSKLNSRIRECKQITNDSIIVLYNQGYISIDHGEVVLTSKIPQVKHDDIELNMYLKAASNLAIIFKAESTANIYCDLNIIF